MEDENSNESKNTKSDSIGLKYFKTLSLCCAILCLGFCIAVLGPTLPTIAYNLQVHISTLAYIVPSRGLGYLLGSIVSGLVYEKFDPNLLIFVSLFLTACGTIVIPFFNQVVFIAIACCTLGVTMGFLDTAGNVMCLQTWGEESGPYLQSFHFSFAIGTTIAPLIALPFIMAVDSNEKAAFEVTTESAYFLESSTNAVIFERFYEVVYVFVFCAGMGWVVSFSFLYLTCFHRNIHSDQKNTVEEEGSVFRIKMLCLLFLFFLVYVGMEVAYGLYIYTFAINSKNDYTKTDATALNTIFWGAFAVGRFIAIFASKLVSPTKLMIFDLIGTFVAAVTLACFPYYSKSADFIFWIATGLYGLSLSSIFPTGITWAEQYITITGKAAMVLVVGGAAGEMILPFVVGQYIETNPMFLLYFGVATTCISIALFILLHLLAKTKGKRLKNNVTFEVVDQQVDEKETFSLN